MKKIISLAVCIVMLLGMLSVACFADDSAYWAAQKAYREAVEKGDESAILAAVKQIEAAYPNPSNQLEYDRLAFPCQKAATIYEKQTKYNDALIYYQKFLKYITWLDQNTSADYSFLLKSVPLLMEYLSVEPEVYAATTNQKTVPYYGAKYEPRLGTYFGTCNTFTEGSESAFLLYVSFGSESIRDFAWRIPKTTNDYILEVAWNLQKENLEGLNEVNSGVYDDYISENARYLSSLTGKVILRFGAEVNCWNDNTTKAREMITAYKKAYVRVAKVIREKAPNVALVFSPTVVSNLSVTIEDFYPGDEYVDWVGMSAYQDIHPAAKNTVSGEDAYYGRGHYDDMMVKIKHIVETYGDRKPIMISECGFAYADRSGLQTQAHAVQKIKEFYSYVNCVYPQVKLVLYFDVPSAPVSGYAYALEGNPAVLNAYNQTIADNAAMQGTLPGGVAKSYTNIDGFSEKTNTLDFKVYASYPGHSKTSVVVKVDGKKVISSSSAPYSFKIDADRLSTGVHTVLVTAKSGKTSRTVIKCLKKASSGKITCVGSLRDVPSSHWAINYIDEALRDGVFNGVSFTTFEPDAVMTRAMFVQVLANISGADLAKYKTSSFKDVKNNAWYCKAVMWANKNGIVSGVGNGKFAPDATVTREQMCAFLTRYAKYAGINMPTGTTTVSFADQKKISSWAKKDVQICQKAGLISGEKQGGKYYFNPQNGATRAQAALILELFLDF